jgi:hypothetical protein
VPVTGNYVQHTARLICKNQNMSAEITGSFNSLNL